MGESKGWELAVMKALMPTNNFIPSRVCLAWVAVNHHVDANGKLSQRLIAIYTYILGFYAPMHCIRGFITDKNERKT